MSFLKQVLLVDSKTIKTNGRPRTVYFIIKTGENKEN